MKNKLLSGFRRFFCLLLSVCIITAQVSALADPGDYVSPNEAEIFTFLTEEMGFNTAAAVGIMANMYYESSFNPQAGGDNGTSYGLCQWHASRKETMIQWCKDNGYKYKTVKGQLNYLKHELSANDGQYLYNGKTIADYMYAIEDTADGAYEAGAYWCIKYEVPANKETVSVTRGNTARDVYWPRYLVRKDLSELEITLSEDPLTYTGKAQLPKITIYDPEEDKTLTRKQDYKVKGVDNVEAGTASVTLRGIGKYTGSISAEFKILLPQSSLTKADNLTGGIRLQWEKVPGAVGYRIYRGEIDPETGEESSLKKIKGTSNTDMVKWTDTTAEDGKTYVYHLRAIDDEGTESQCAEGITITRLTVPQLKTPSSKLKGNLVKWSKVAGAEGYFVYRKADSEKKWVRVATITKGKTTSWTDTDVKNGSHYTYTVRAWVKPEGASSYTRSYYDEAGKSVYFVAAPEMTSLKSSKAGTMSVAWTKNSKAASYIIQYDTKSEFTSKLFQRVYGASTLNYTLTKLKKGKTYYARVRSCVKIDGDNRYSAWSESMKIKTKK